MDEIARRVLRFGHFTLDLTRGCLRSGNQDIDLPPKAFEVLCHLVENAGRLVPKQELHESVWPNVFVSDGSLVQCIRELRHKLGDDEHRLIKTVSRRGYMLDATTTKAPQALVAGTAAGDEMALDTVGGAMARDRVAAAPRTQLSLIVLPFQNPDDDPEQGSFAAGVTEDLADGMSRFGMTVIARSTALAYNGKPMDVREVGRELAVRYVLEGSVRRSGDQVRVTAELVDASTAANIWTETFDIDRRDLTRLRDEVTARLANCFNIWLIYAESARSLRERPHDPEAWDFMIRARALYMDRLRGGDLSEPQRLFREALRRDETLREAWIGLSFTYLHNARFSPTREHELSQAHEAAERAMALDRRAWSSHMVMGWVRSERKQPEMALAEFEHAVQLNPNVPFGHVMLANANVRLGRPENALEPLRKAMRISPNDPALSLFQLTMGSACLHLQRDVEAVEWLNKSLALNPRESLTRLFLASALALSGREVEAKAGLAELLRSQPKFTISRLKALELSDAPAFRAQRGRIYEGLRHAGLPEE